jgi:outer membrane protein TolC
MIPSLARALSLSVLLILMPAVADAQDRLSLADAVARTLAHNAGLRAAGAAAGEASARVGEARAGYLPRVDLVGSWQRGNQPVFAFSSLLAQRRFSEADFAIGSLNNPDAVANYRGGLSIEQVVFDGNRTRHAVQAARIGSELASLGRTALERDLAVAAVRAYGEVLQAMVTRRAADSAVSAAEEDVRRAERRRDTGLATEADALALQVHLAQMRELAIRTASQEAIARARTNALMGDSLDRQYTFEEPPPSAVEPAGSVRSLEQAAREHRPEIGRAALQHRLADTARAGARASFLPQVSLQGFVELNGRGITRQASAWLFGAQLRWTVFNGLADVARLRATSHAATRAAAEREAAESSVLLEVRTAAAELDAARARVKVGQAVVAQAAESQRIVRDRYEAGLATVNDVLRAAHAVLDAESLRVAAFVDLLVGAAALDRATGRAPLGAR